MPIYEYHCPDCGARKEHLQKVSAEPLTSCPACGGTRYSKQLSAAAFQLKGSGWYATDFKGGSGASAPKAEASAAPCGAACACPAATAQ